MTNPLILPLQSGNGQANPLVRPLEIDDIEVVSDLVRHLSTRILQQKDLLANLRVMATSPRDTQWFVAVHNQRVQGFGGFVPYYRATSGMIAQAEEIVTDVASREQGLGRLVMDTIEDRARECGVRKMLLTSKPDAVGFYKKLGYKEKPDIVMEKLL